MLLVLCGSASGKPVPSSPNGKISVQTLPVSGTKDGFGGLQVFYGGQLVTEISRFGIATKNKGNDLHFEGMEKGKKVKVDYRMLSGKRLHCTNQANEWVLRYTYSDGSPLNVRLRLFNDGIAFRYELSGLQADRIAGEQTTYRIPEGTRRWFQQWSDGYEGFFPLTTSGRPAPEGRTRGDNCRWGYPALIQPADQLFALFSEANIEHQQSASSLKNEASPEAYVVFMDENDADLSGEWHTPWRVVIIGSLADVVASTLVTDVSEPCKLSQTDWIQPGVVSWVYWAYNHGSNDYNIISKYVDLAVALRLPYVLIDAEWDEMKDGKTIEDAVAYARSRNVKPIIWYNSTVGWIDGAPGPKYRLNKPEDREKEFAWCESIGVAGVKIDFFSGDNRMNMDYCIDLLESAARHHLLVNFHGATIPRGWQRTYPNLLSTEGVYGAEWYNNVPTFTDKAACHNATLPFTRNVIGPMDYTPCAFSDSQHPHITTHAHELALTVLYESGLQHLADRPESFLAQPEAVRRFFGLLPTVWDDTRLLSGYPGESVVMARRSGKTWFVAGINGTDDVKTLTLNWTGIATSKSCVTAFFDGQNVADPWDIRTVHGQPSTSIVCQPRGGFVMIVEPK